MDTHTNYTPNDKNTVSSTSQNQTSTEQIMQFYNTSPLHEWQRMERHRMEFAVTLRAITAYLPVEAVQILDIGGGPGRYSFALAERHHHVTLVDLAQSNLDFARQRARELDIDLVDYVQANALHLTSFPSDKFSFVLLLGPLYHLLNLSERQQALREAMRVLKPGGLIFVSFITRHAPLRDLVKHDPALILSSDTIVQNILHTGIYRGDHPTLGFTSAYFAHPTEICPLVEAAGCTTLALVGCEGIVSQLEEHVNQLSGPAWDAWVDLNYQLGKDPTAHSSADHLLYIGRKSDLIDK